VDVKWQESDVGELTYNDPSGRLGSELQVYVGTSDNQASEAAAGAIMSL
jgi:hypothetical protein